MDGNGEEVSTITNGVTKQIIDDNSYILYFQSNYFQNPDSLYIVGSRMSALDKEQAEVVVDVINKRIVHGADERLQIKNIYKKGNDLEFVFVMQTEDPRGVYKFNHSLLRGIYKDTKGEIHSDFVVGSWSSCCPEDGEGGYTHEFALTIENGYNEDQITFLISDYPAYIEEEFKVKIK